MPWLRRRLSLSLRSLMILVLLLGGGLGWLVHRARVQREAVAAVLRAGGTVEYDLDGNGRRPVPAWWSWLRATWLVKGLGVDYFENVHRIRIDGHVGVDDALMVHLGRLHLLEELQIGDGRSITDAGVARLCNARRLRAISMDFHGDIGRGPGYLKGLPDLEELGLNISELADADLEQLSGMVGLKFLGLDGKRITDAGLAHLENLVNLEAFFLTGGQVTGEGLVHLERMSHLKSVALDETKVKSLEHLATLPNLAFISLRGTSIDDAGVATLASFPKLDALSLAKTQIGDAELSRIASMTTLTLLHVSETNVTDAGLVKLQGLPRLRNLRLDGTGVTDAGMSHLAKCPELAMLSLRNTRITDAGLGPLSALKKCEHLFLQKTSVTPAGVQRLQSQFPRLQIYP